MPNPTGKGGFKKGVVSNPYGRGKGKKNNPDLELDVKRLAKAQTPAAVATLSEIMHDPKVKPEVRVLASNSLLDRGWGRPHQSVDLEATFSKKLTELTLEEARAFARTLDAALAPTPVLIEGTVEGTSKPELP